VLGADPGYPLATGDHARQVKCLVGGDCQAEGEDVAAVVAFAILWIQAAEVVGIVEHPVPVECGITSQKGAQTEKTCSAGTDGVYPPVDVKRPPIWGDAGEDAAIDDRDEVRISNCIEDPAWPGAVNATDEDVAVQRGSYALRTDQANGQGAYGEARCCVAVGHCTLGDGYLARPPLCIPGSGVEGTVQVAFLDAVMVDEDDVADAQPGKGLGDHAANTAQPDDANPDSG